MNLSLFLLVLFVVFKAGTTMFVHVHTIDGVKIVHSHPYSGNNHSHSSSQIHSIAFASAQLMTAPGGAMPLQVCLYLLYVLLQDNNESRLMSGCVLNINPRAPPSFY